VEEPVEEVAEEETPQVDLSAPQELPDIEDVEEFPETLEELEDIQDEIVDIDVEADLAELPMADEMAGPTGPAASAQRGHALAHVFARLWDHRGEEGTVDLYLAEGELLSPEFFSPQLSRSTHGVFADRAEDGTYTVISIPWESVKKAVLKKVEGLPEQIFH
jgi:hypothetical protein